jgi:hypothetical protein
VSAPGTTAGEGPVDFVPALPRFRRPFTAAAVEAAFHRFTREAVLIRLLDGRMTWEEKPGYQSRNASVVELVRRCVAVQSLPDTVLCVFTGDRRRSGEPADDFIFTFCRTADETNPLFPNFNFVHQREAGIGDYFSEVLPALTAAGARPWHERADRCFFGGAATNPMRRRLWRACRGRDRFDIRLLNWDDPATPALTLPEHAGHRYLLNLNGWSYSGRLHYLLPLGSCVVQLLDTRRSQRFQEFHTHLFEPGRHLLTVPYRRWEPGAWLRRRIERAIAHHDGQAIAAAGRERAGQVFTSDRVLVYLAKVIGIQTAAMREAA